MPPGTLQAIERILTGGGAPPEPGALVVRADAFQPRSGDRVILEDGSDLRPGSVPPLGYHRLISNGREVALIVSPGHCFLPEDLRVWGWAVQLYALRSRASWGIGDLGDLSAFGRTASGKGARVSLINPLHAPTPSVPQENSPYYPSSRCFRNPLYLRIEDVPGAAGVAEVEPLARMGRALNAGERIDRDRVFELKMRALRLLFGTSRRDDGFDGFVTSGGRTLEGFATYCALAEVHGSDWHGWPAGLRDPDGAAVAGFRRKHADEVRFHAWLQWLLDQQLSTASDAIGVIHDLAIGVDPKGADAWLWQDCFAQGVSVGAPPDDYNAEGQEWGVLGFDPVHLRARAYEPFIEMVRATMRHSAGIRFDHVMGMFRLFWVPNGSSAADGAYVRYPANDLLDILALESQRAGSLVIGEDLGTVEDGVREEMARRMMLSYRLLWFLDDDIESLPRLAMASANTHDLPTAAGLWTGADVEAHKALGLDPNEEFAENMKGRILRHVGVDASAGVSEVVDRSCEVLARSASAVVTVSLEDALGTVDRYNMPGTTGEANWTATLPLPLEDLVEHPSLDRISAIFNKER